MTLRDFTSMCDHLEQILDNAPFSGGSGSIQKNEYLRIRASFYKKLKNGSKFSFLPTTELTPELQALYQELYTFCASLIM